MSASVVPIECLSDDECVVDDAPAPAPAASKKAKKGKSKRKGKAPAAAKKDDSDSEVEITFAALAPKPAADEVVFVKEAQGAPVHAPPVPSAQRNLELLRGGPSPQGQADMEVTSPCQACNKDTLSAELVACTVGHRVCVECGRLAMQEGGEGGEPGCPFAECGVSLTQSALVRILSEARARELLCERFGELLASLDEPLCGACNTAADELPPLELKGLGTEPACRRRLPYKCDTCGRSTCRACGGPAHAEDLCSQGKVLLFMSAADTLSSTTGMKNQFERARASSSAAEAGPAAAASSSSSSSAPAASSSSSSPSPAANTPEFAVWTVKKLQAELKRRGLSHQGRKEELVQRLADANAGKPPCPPAPAKAAASSSKKRGRGSSGSTPQSKAWARGVGYGGESGSARFDPTEHRKREEKADEKTSDALRKVLKSLPGPGADRQATDDALPGALLCSCLLPVLRGLLRNDSFLDVCERSELYLSAVAAVGGLAAVPALAPALVLGAPGEDPDTPQLDELLRGLRTAADVFVRGAISTADELLSATDVRSTVALGLALEVRNVHDALGPALRSFRAARARARAEEEAREPPSKKAKGAEEAAGEYCRALRPLLFEQVQLTGCGRFYFDGANAKAELAMYDQMAKMQMMAAAVMGGGVAHPGKGAGWAGATAEGSRNRTLHINKELAALSTSLPLTYESAIFVRIDEARMDRLSAVILGPVDTPYAHGVFEFHIQLPPTYPQQPPKVQYMTTGGGTARFNPNLYDSGKVCLSLLGTWEGPGWDPRVSTLIQVLLSIQALILVAEPFYNEPGFENRKSDQQSRQYNRQIQGYTSRFAILDALRNPPTGFAEVVRTHYRLKKEAVQETVRAWAKDGASVPSQVVQAIENELAKL
eukprot:tig00000939_g5489.t1